MKYRNNALLLLALAALALPAATGPASASDKPPLNNDPYSLTEGPLPNLEGLGQGPQPGAIVLPGAPADYAWWNGCSPTAAGMLFGWWEENGYDAFPGSHRNLPATYPGTSSNPADYADARGVVASWEHKQAGASRGFTYGSYESHAPNSLADFLSTVDASTARYNMAHGLETFGAWDDPRTTAIESKRFKATTVYTSQGWSYADYRGEIDAGRPVLLGLSSSAGGHSVLGVGYNNADGRQDVLLLTTWHWGLQEWSWADETYSGYGFSVYSGTLMNPDPASTPSLSAYFSITHTLIRDLTVVLGIGDPAHPDWSTTVWNRGTGGLNNLVLTDIDCSALEPTFPHEKFDWFLQVTDNAGGNTGTIEDFQIRYAAGQEVFDYAGPPMAIKDRSTSYVYLATPEPGTLSLLALGGAFWLVRRRPGSLPAAGRRPRKRGAERSGRPRPTA